MKKRDEVKLSDREVTFMDSRMSKDKKRLPKQELTVAEAVMFANRILHFVENLGAPMVLKQMFRALRKLSNDAVKANNRELADDYEKQIKAVVTALQAMGEEV